MKKMPMNGTTIRDAAQGNAVHYSHVSTTSFEVELELRDEHRDVIFRHECSIIGFRLVNDSGASQAAWELRDIEGDCLLDCHLHQQ